MKNASKQTQVTQVSKLVHVLICHVCPFFISAIFSFLCQIHTFSMTQSSSFCVSPIITKTQLNSWFLNNPSFVVKKYAQICIYFLSVYLKYSRSLFQYAFYLYTSFKFLFLNTFTTLLLFGPRSKRVP